MIVVKKLLIIFLVAFVLNLIWEHLHSVLYVHYQGEAITSFILTHAALFDAIFTTLLSVPFMVIPLLRKRFWIAVVVAVGFAVGLERYALSTSRWMYTDSMPVIPILGSGLTPTIQLGLLAALSFYIAHRLVKNA